MTKKAYKQKHFSVITKNLRGEVLTKNSVTFRMGWVKNEKLRMKNFSIYGSSLKNLIFRGEGGSRKTTI